MLFTSCIYKKSSNSSPTEHFRSRETWRRAQVCEICGQKQQENQGEKRNVSTSPKLILCIELEMALLRWLFLVFMCSSGFGSTCLESSICSEMSNKDQMLDCVHFCMSVIQTDSPDLSESAQQRFHHYDDDDDDLLLPILLSTLASDNKPSDLNVHSDKRRSYSMEHFRWGKPTGRKRRPVKVFFSSLEGGGSPGSSSLFRARRHLIRDQHESKRGALKVSHLNQNVLRSRVSSRSPGLLKRKYGPYRMSHFRWGSPPASKLKNRFMKSWKEKPQGQLSQFLQNILVKDAQTIMG